LAERHARDRAQADRERITAVEVARDQALERAAAAEAQRDALLAERAERSGTSVSAGQLEDVRELARLARGVADRLERLVATPVARRPLALPGGVARESARATEFLLRSGAVVFVDGYNVTKLAWPDEELAVQRARGLDLADDLARRLGTELVVVFDGAAVVGSHSRQRRLVRVTYSPPGVTADDVIRAEVAAVPTSRPVVVVTNDQAVRRDVSAAGANLISSDAFLALTRPA
jgi:predicted RNA-binding protein with PIN domain